MIATGNPSLPPRAGFGPALLRLACGALLAAALVSCKIVVTVPYGGKVVTEDGFECLEGQTCVIEVTDDTFASTFTAVPSQGHSFTRWRRKPAALCGDYSGDCPLATAGFGDYQVLLDILASDQAFHLEPVFVQYNPNYWGRILDEIEQGSFATRNFLYAVAPDVTNCDPGTITGAAKTRALQAVNQVRALHSLPAVSIDNFYDTQMQQTSLVQKANNYLNHFPSQGDACFTQAARDGASSANLGSSTQPTDPASDVFGWTNDNNNAADLMKAGHRRWILHPELGYVSYGQVEGYSALKIFGFGMPPDKAVPASLQFVAMPYKSYPYVLVSQGSAPTPWSFSMVPPAGVSATFDYFSNATVKVIDRDTNTSLPVQNLHRDNERFGLANFISWMVTGWDYDKLYEVRISGIRLPDGNTQTITYPVMVDRYDLFRVNYPLEATDQQTGNRLQGRFNTATDKDSYALQLGGSKTLTGRSEFSNQGFFILVYNESKRLVVSADSAITRDFAPGRYTIILSPCDESGLCYQGTSTYTVTIN